MPGLIINGQAIPVPGLDIVNWQDDHDLRLGSTDLRPRNHSEQWVRLIVLHSTLGIPGGNDNRPQVVKEGFGPGGDHAERLVRYWTRESRGAGAHLIVDFDGRVACCADLATEATYHARHANGVSVGVEIAQGSAEAEFYEGQLQTAVLLVDALTNLLGIQRQVPERYVGPSRRLMASVDDVVGVVGHRDLTNTRGRGDPGNAIFNRLGLAGYDTFDFDQALEREEWRRRQRTLGVPDADGVAGPRTVSALKAATFISGLKGRRPAGIWVPRPVDALLQNP